MSFFPLLNINESAGFCTVHNFPPNNWENISKEPKSLWSIYSDGKKWITNLICKLNYGESKTIYYKDFNLNTKSGVLPVIALQFRDKPLEKKLSVLPDNEFKFTKTPEWRATVGFNYKGTSTSYQGEINPFPTKASLLTFHPFIQYNEIENFFVFVNLEAKPELRESKIEIYNSNNRKLIDIVKIKSNSINIIPLNRYKIKQQELPIFLSRNMAGIPFGFGINKTAPMLSLEHTHPPASFVVHGNRFNYQKKIKEDWFKILNNEQL